MRRAAVAGLLAIALLVGACGEPPKYTVVVEVTSDEGKPMPGVAVTLGDGTHAFTDDLGQVRHKVTGEEGSRLSVSIKPPRGYDFVGKPRDAVVLRHLVDAEGSGKPLPVEFPVKLAPKTRSYAVLVRTNAPNLPVEAFGEKRAITNKLGVAMFLYQGTPSEALTVKIDTSAQPRLQPPSPTQTFQLGARAQAFVVKEHFTLAVDKPRPHKPKPVGPKPL